MNRTELTKRGDVCELTCDELRSTWVFIDDWLAIQAQFTLLKLFAWWDQRGVPSMTRQDFEQLATFIMRSYEHPLTANLFCELRDMVGNPRRPMFPEAIIDELPQWTPKVIEGGGS